MSSWTVRFTGNTIGRTVDANGKEDAIAMARDSLKCPNMWEYASAIPVHEQTIATPETEAT